MDTVRKSSTHLGRSLVLQPLREVIMTFTNSNLELISALHPNSLVVDVDLKILAVNGEITSLLNKSEQYLDKSILDVIVPSLKSMFEENLIKSKDKKNKNFSEILKLNIEGHSVDQLLSFTYVNGCYVINLSQYNKLPSNIILAEIQNLESVGGFYYDIENKNISISSEIKKIFDSNTELDFNLLFDSVFFGKECSEEIKEKLKDLKPKEFFEESFSITTELGKTKVIRLKVRAIQGKEFDSISGFSGAIKDITSENQAQERSRFALSCSQTGFWDWNIKENNLFWDEKMLELYEIEEYKSTDLYRLWVNSIVDEDKEATAQALQSALDNKAEYNLYFRIKSSAGKIKTIHGTGKVISDKNGNPARMLGANIDVTSIIEKDELLIEQRRIADLSTRLAQLGELSAELGHEINNPLTVCMSSLTLSKLNLKETELNDKTLRNIELLGTGLNRISSLVNNMRNYLHSAGNENSKLIDINDAIKENFELIESLTSKSKATIELELSPSINYECNSTQMSQVLINLMTNAIFAVKETSEKTVRITTYGEDGDIFIRIDDSGTGISPENREQIFEKFFTTKSHNQGTGIGLSLSNEIIQGMGGTLELVDSKLGGASFLITLSKQKRDEFTCNA